MIKKKTHHLSDIDHVSAVDDVQELTTDQTKQENQVDQKKQTQTDLKQELSLALEREKRALADYQNLVRRNQQERLKLFNAIHQEIISALLPPFEHLNLAVRVIKDQGLNMVVADFWRIFKEMGLEEINPTNQEFDLETMEAVEKMSEGNRVIKVVSCGYKLNGAVIKHAQVMVGNLVKKESVKG